MISTHSRTSRLRTSRPREARLRVARAGFSLIEVAIALVIFVIGALAIIRIFPGALSVIGNNGNQQIATNLNRTQLVTSKSQQTDSITQENFNAVPYSTFNIAVNNDAANTLAWSTAANTNHTDDFRNPGKPTNGDIDASVVGVPRFNNSLPTPEDINTGANTGISKSALSRFRGIQGEKARVFTMGNPAANYVRTQFPISLAKINGVNKDTLLAPTISQEYVVQNARIDKLGRVTFANATITDVNGDVIRLDAATDPSDVAKNMVSANSTIYVSYRYYNSAGNVWGVNDEALPISSAVYSPITSTNLTDATLTVNPPTTGRGSRVTYNPAVATTGAVAEIIDVRVKRLVGVGTFGIPGAPDDFASNDPNYPSLTQVGDARLGLVRIPVSVTAGRTVSVDYIADWSFLLQDGPPQVSANATYPAPDPLDLLPINADYRQVALGAPFIEDQAPASLYSLLIDSNVAHRSYYGTGQVDPPPIGRLVRAIDPQQREDELRSGKVTFITDKNATETVRSRVAYRTRDSWAKQLSVAANAYKPFVTNSAEPWRDYYLGGDNYLYFHAGEAGKTISISYRTTDDNGPLVDRSFVISTDIIDTPTASPALVPAVFAASGRVSRIKLTDAQGRVLPDNSILPTAPTDPPQLISIQAVKGVSITSRTAYINGTKYAQKIDTTTRGAN